VSELAVLAAVDVEPADFLAVVGTSAVAGTISALVTGRGLLLPAVVVELLLGVVIGPQVLGLEVSEFIQFFADLGLGMLFFFAGYEIDLHRIAGGPLRLAAVGWAISLAFGVHDRGYPRGRRDRALAALHGLGHGHDRHRHADPDLV
jgi:hypothetical protein